MPNQIGPARLQVLALTSFAIWQLCNFEKQFEVDLRYPEKFWLQNDKLKSELRRLERRTARNGRETIDHPPRGSDDIANAVAGVTWLTFQNGGQFTMPEAYGERICSGWNFYTDGLAEEPVPDRYW
jgi:hypothetical protein